MNTCKLFYALSISLLLGSASFSQKSHFIKTHFDGAKDGDTVYLFSNRNITDTAFIKNNEAWFSLAKMDNQWDTYFINYKNKADGVEFSLPLFHNAKSDLFLKVSSDSKTFIISGDTNATLQNEFYKGLAALTQKNGNHFSKELSKEYYINWVVKHNHSPFSAAIVRMFLDQTNILKELDTVAVRYFYQLLPEAIENNYEASIMQKQLALYDEKYSLLPVNSMAPSFVTKDTADNDLELEKFKGKWLLIDFWASWCGPCRRNSPLLKDFYLKYHDKGLEVLSISVDTNGELWKKAIVKDEMIWQHGSDLSGFISGVAQAYQITAVPHYFLISPEGRIVTKTLGGDVVIIEKAIKDFLK